VFKLSNETLPQFIQYATEAGACSETIKYVSCLTVEELLNRPEAPYWAYWYAHNVLETRWEEMEHLILRDPRLCYWYARSVIGARWKEAEDVIRQSPLFAYLYARYILRTRWKEAEDVIRKDEHLFKLYETYILFGEFSDFTNLFIER
jgi:hypothetical protein